MSPSGSGSDVPPDERIQRAARLAEQGQALQAEGLLRQVLRDRPHDADAMAMLGDLAQSRGDGQAALDWLHQARRASPNDPQRDLDLAMALLRLQRRGEAREVLDGTVASHPEAFVAWLLLGALRHAAGDDAGAMKAWFQAVTRAQRTGHWVDRASTPPELLTLVLQAIEVVRTRRRDILAGSYADLRVEHGGDALARVDEALRCHLREGERPALGPMQQPKFFFFPGLPNTPFHDPALQPWAGALRSSFGAIRAEALKVIEEDQRLPSFVRHEANAEYVVSGEGPSPSWEALFFYRRGERYDANHRRCPRTSDVLDSIDLCRIDEQAPEILFSVLRPGSHINPHHGVSNVRLVLHLPLVVPPGCALNLIGHGSRSWQEGELGMFDDTYLHEAWNRSDRTRVILLMDCWNPHLTPVEKQAVKALIETITSLQLADRAARAAVGPSA